MKPTNITPDKALHFIVAQFIFIVASLFLGIGWGYLTTLVIATLKEVYDKISGKGTPDAWDLFWSFAGATITLMATGL